MVFNKQAQLDMPTVAGQGRHLRGFSCCCWALQAERQHRPRRRRQRGRGAAHRGDCCPLQLLHQRPAFHASVCHPERDIKRALLWCCHIVPGLLCSCPMRATTPATVCCPAHQRLVSAAAGVRPASWSRSQAPPPSAGRPLAPARARCCGCRHQQACAVSRSSHDSAMFHLQHDHVDD